MKTYQARLKFMLASSFILLALGFLVLNRPAASASGKQETKSANASAVAASVQTGGLWSPPMNTKDVMVHLSLLPDGRLLYWARDKKPAPANPTGPNDGAWDIGDRSNTYVVDPLYLDNPDAYTTVILNPTTNLFCSGHTFLQDGRLLVTGGHGKVKKLNPITGQYEDDPQYDSTEGIGEPDINIFNYRDNTWTLAPPSQQMERGRWYPYNVTLGTGETLIMSGTYWDGLTPPVPAPNDEPTIRSLQGTTRTLHADATYDEVAQYPYISLTPAGKVFNAKSSPAQGDPALANRMLDPYAHNNNTGGDGTFTSFDPAANFHREAACVMYEPGKVLLAGGSLGSLTGLQTNTAEIINLNDATPHWTQVGNMTWRRKFPTGTLLPDGKVLVTGGTSCSGGNRLDCANGAVQTPELWNPATGTWTQMNPTASNEPRVYHSVAMLMPDGRVLVGGGGLPVAVGETVHTASGDELCTGATLDTTTRNCRNSGHKTVEFFSPPYLFDDSGASALRPGIVNAPSNISYGQTFTVDIGNVPASDIKNVVLVRLPSVTHTYIQDQRRVVLPHSGAGNSITVTAPANGNLCPPGPYMMFLIRNNGRDTPSVAKVVRVGDIAIDRNSQSFPAVPQNQSQGPNQQGTLVVTAVPTLTWTATSTASWLTIDRASGTGNARVSFTVAQNTTGQNRSAQIRVRVAGRETAIGLNFNVYQASTFGDVPVTSPFNKFISALYARNITAGCGGGNFCPDNDITRGQAAVFLQQILTETVVDSKSVYVPNPAPGATGYTDVESHPLRRFITYVTRRGIATGCGVSSFCPDAPMTRKDMVIWSLRAINDDRPPVPATARFADVPTTDPAAPFIEEGYRLGLVAGCGTTSTGQPLFCPNEAAKRGTMAVFLAQAFGL